MKNNDDEVFIVNQWINDDEDDIQTSGNIYIRITNGHLRPIITPTLVTINTIGFQILFTLIFLFKLLQVSSSKGSKQSLDNFLLKVFNLKLQKNTQSHRNCLTFEQLPLVLYYYLTIYVTRVHSPNHSLSLSLFLSHSFRFSLSIYLFDSLAFSVFVTPTLFLSFFVSLSLSVSLSLLASFFIAISNSFYIYRIFVIKNHSFDYFDCFY